MGAFFYIYSNIILNVDPDPEMLIVCALAHIGATFKVKLLLKNFLCAFKKQLNRRFRRENIEKTRKTRKKLENLASAKKIYA